MNVKIDFLWNKASCKIGLSSTDCKLINAYTIKSENNCNQLIKSRVLFPNTASVRSLNHIVESAWELNPPDKFVLAALVLPPPPILPGVVHVKSRWKLLRQ